MSCRADLVCGRNRPRGVFPDSVGGAVGVGETKPREMETPRPREDLQVENPFEAGAAVGQDRETGTDLSSGRGPLSAKEMRDRQKEEAMNASLKSMFHSVASSSVPVKSQQMDEPDLDYEQKLDIIEELFWGKPVIFLERFHKLLREEHLSCFDHLPRDYTVTFYCDSVRKCSVKKTARANVRNKRYAALQQLIKDGEYFSDEQMRNRDPLLYEHYIGQHMTEDEYVAQRSKTPGDAMSLSELLMDTYQERMVQQRLQQQQEQEDACVEEEEEDEEEDEESVSRAEDWMPSADEKTLLREEFVSQMHQRFLDGEERDFDYSAVDENPEFDNLEIVSRDEEDKYFDEEEPVDADSMETESDKE
uniref:Coiled-coil domain containing 97 n=1 Tax=Callorhinchus milii TaxID=7868 RepID=A0A4W3HBD4_CALMI|eukprot:gi/632984421/ref/XP_007909130.1/ PREDICTED: coiled-coil domain-containing protein 97 [Callorhinchus milii]